MKILRACFLGTVLALSLCGCNMLFLPEPTGDADMTGSWSLINQDIARPDNWKQIVMDRQFQLGKKWTKGDKTYISYGTYPTLNGSTVCVPMAVEFARQHLGLDDQQANNIVNFGTTATAYTSLIHGSPQHQDSCPYIESQDARLGSKLYDLIIVTEPSDEELVLAQKLSVELIIEPVCYDALVFITHKDNPVSTLSIEQIRKIYSGEITNWKDVGGLDQKIKTFQREENSGSQTIMENKVMKGLQMLPPNKVEVLGAMNMLVEAVGEYENEQYSIGYTFKYYIDTLYKNKNIKTLNVENISPDTINIQDDSYPFTTNYFAVIRSEDRENVGGKFMDWMISDEGQRCIKQAGYCPMR